MTTLPDIYFLKEWGNYYKTKEFKGDFQLFELKDDMGHIYYPFIKRPIIINDVETNYFDTITPYGFNGPIILKCLDNKREEIIALFDEKFQNYCDKNNIITEYIRFNPWLKNHSDFKDIYKFRNHGTTLYIDIDGNDFFMDEFSSNARTQVRRGRKNNLEIKFDFDGSSSKEFARLYALMAKKNNIDDYYKFSEEFLRNSFQVFEGKQFIISAIYEGKYIAASLVVFHEEKLHYFLTATDPDYYHMAANSLLIYEICRWGSENNKKVVHLGGAGNVEGVKRYKKGFTKTDELELWIGYKTRNQKVYDELVTMKKNVDEISNYKYFPLYRG